MNFASHKSIMGKAIAITLALSPTWAMDKFGINIGGKTLTSRDTHKDLSNRQLSILPPEVGNFASLTSLFLSHNKLTALPLAFGNLTALKVLSLADNKLNIFPSEISNLTALTELYLGKNQLTYLPQQLCSLTGLTNLSLIANQVNTIAPEIGNLTSLTRLNLSYNFKLTILSREIGKLTALTELDLCCTKMVTLPSTLGNLAALKVLDLRGVPLEGEEFQWVKTLRIPIELNNLRLFYAKRDLQMKAPLLILTHRLDRESPLAHLPWDIIKYFCEMNIQYRLQ